MNLNINNRRSYKITITELAILFLIVGLVFSLVVSFPLSHLALALLQNATSVENNTQEIINPKDKSMTLINKTTNETIGVMPYTGDKVNKSTNESINNFTLLGTKGNITNNKTLSEKFGSLDK